MNENKRKVSIHKNTSSPNGGKESSVREAAMSSSRNFVQKRYMHTF